jgi:hypothetical protein
MNRRFALLIAALALAACVKKPKPTVEPTPTEDPTPVEPVVIDDSVPQEPDPVQIAEGAQRYLMGEYAATIELLQPIYADLKERKQYRASALAGTWLALSHAKEVFENGKEPAEWARAMSQSTADPEVVGAAALAMGAYLIGNEEFDAALASLAAAAESPDAATGSLGHVLKAEALIGAAFGGGEVDSVQHPEKFDEAKLEYDAAATRAKGHASEDLLIGRIEEGHAALADYRKDKPGVCPHATAALSAFMRAGAKRLLEGPAKLARDNKCAVPADLSVSEDS